MLDGDGQQIPYTVEEIKQMVHLEPENNNVMVPFAIKGENYGPMTFARMFYIGSGTYGKAYYNPVDTILTVKKQARAISIKAYHDNGVGGAGKLAQTMKLPGGWTGSVNMSAWSSLPRGKKYRFQVINQEGKSFTINNIRVLYNN